MDLVAIKSSFGISNGFRFNCEIKDTRMIVLQDPVIYYSRNWGLLHLLWSLVCYFVFAHQNILVVGPGTEEPLNYDAGRLLFYEMVGFAIYSVISIKYVSNERLISYAHPLWKHASF